MVPSPSPSPVPSQYPEIAHVRSKRFCAVLRSNVGPAIPIIQANDTAIAQAQPLLADYDNYLESGSTGRRDLTLLKMENLVQPLVKNLASIEKLLQDPHAFPARPANDEDAKLLDIRNKLEQVAASQEESLDVINGLVASEQMGQMQHEGLEQANAINSDMKDPRPTADPRTRDANLPGLSPNPYYIDPTNFPETALGLNPHTRVEQGLQWTRTQAAQQEPIAAKAIIDNLQLCK